MPGDCICGSTSSPGLLLLPLPGSLFVPTVLRWQGEELTGGIGLAELHLSRVEGREPVPWSEHRRLFGSLDAFAERCADPRSGGVLLECFCRVVRVGGEE